MNGTIRIVAACALALACLHQPAVATEAAKDVSKEIGDLRSTVVSAEVYLVAPGTASRINFTERDVLGVASCMYEASERKDVDSLIDLLADASIVEQVEPARNYNARIVVYLHTVDGNTIPLVTGPQYTTAPAWGTYNHTVRVTTKMGFEPDLRHWAAQRKPARTTVVCHGD